MKKIKFDEATKKKAGEIWCQSSYDGMIDFLADVANRQLEVMEKPAFADPKRQNHQAEIAGHLENGFRARGSYGGNFWHDVAEHAAMIVTSRFVVEPKREDFNNSGEIEKPAFEAGKKYRTRDGRIVTLEPLDQPDSFYKFVADGFYIGFNGQISSSHASDHDLLPGAIEESGQACVSPPLVAEIDWKARAEAAEKRAEKAEAAMEAVRALIERDLVINSVNQWEAGYTSAMRNIADAAGFTIVPAQPLKVIRHD